MDILYRCLLYCCHLIISLWFCLAGLVRRLKVEIRDMKHSSFADELVKSKLSMDEFQKTPEHLGIVLNEETISFSDIAHIIVWCLAVGVPYVSIYDLTGFLKSTRLKLYSQTLEVKERLLKKSAHNYKIHLYSGSFKDELENGFLNGHKYKGEVHVSLLNGEDGKSDIIDSTRTVCKDVIEQKVKPTEIKQLCVAKHLQSLPGFHDPDVVVCFGRGQSLIGYLPWHIRLSEIMFFPTHHKFHFREFIRVLELFNHCEQRFGK